MNGSYLDFNNLEEKWENGFSLSFRLNVELFDFEVEMVRRIS